MNKMSLFKLVAYTVLLLAATLSAKYIPDSHRWTRYFVVLVCGSLIYVTGAL